MTALIFESLLPLRLACTGLLLFLSPLAPLVTSSASVAPAPAVPETASSGDLPPPPPADYGCDPDSCIVYRACEGDTLRDISLVFAVPLERLAAVNNLSPRAAIHAGQPILIPPMLP